MVHRAIEKALVAAFLLSIIMALQAEVNAFGCGRRKQLSAVK